MTTIAEVLDKIDEKLLVLKTAGVLKRVEKKKRLFIETLDKNIVFKRDCPAVNVMRGDCIEVFNTYGNCHQRTYSVVLRLFVYDKDDNKDINTEICETIDNIVDIIENKSANLDNMVDSILYKGDSGMDTEFEKLAIFDIVFEIVLTYEVGYGL